MKGAAKRIEDQLASLKSTIESAQKGAESDRVAIKKRTKHMHALFAKLAILASLRKLSQYILTPKIDRNVEKMAKKLREENLSRSYDRRRLRRLIDTNGIDALATNDSELARVGLSRNNLSSHQNKAAFLVAVL